jgi:response regulator NasT
MKTRVLLFNTSLDDLADIHTSLPTSSYDIVETCSELSRLTQLVRTGTVDVVIAVTDKRLEQFFACVQQLNDQHPVPFVVFTYEDSRDAIELAIQAGVSAYIVDGLQANRIASILDTAVLRFKAHQSMRDELNKTKSTLNERKLIDKAKGILMQRSNISEDDAYKAMRKMAMDRNIKIAELAKSVISTVDLVKKMSTT